MLVMSLKAVPLGATSSTHDRCPPVRVFYVQYG